MPYSIIKGKTLNVQPAKIKPTHAQTNLFFNITDIMRLMTQKGATAISVGNFTSVSGKDYTILYAVSGHGSGGHGGEMLDPDHVIALYCPDINVPDDNFFKDFNQL